MIIRKPSIIDLRKVLANFIESEKERDVLMLTWIQLSQNNPDMYSLVAIDKKQGVGLLVGEWLTSTIFMINVLHEKNCCAILIKKLIKDLSPDEIRIDTMDNHTLGSCGFKIDTTTYSMSLRKESSDDLNGKIKEIS